MTNSRKFGLAIAIVAIVYAKAAGNGFVCGRLETAFGDPQSTLTAHTEEVFHSIICRSGKESNPKGQPDRENEPRKSPRVRTRKENRPSTREHVSTDGDRPGSTFRLVSDRSDVPGAVENATVPDSTLGGSSRAGGSTTSHAPGRLSGEISADHLSSSINDIQPSFAQGPLVKSGDAVSPHDSPNAVQRTSAPFANSVPRVSNVTSSRRMAPVVAGPTVEYANTVSGSLAVVADRRIIHAESCGERMRCNGECLGHGRVGLHVNPLCEGLVGDFCMACRPYQPHRPANSGLATACFMDDLPTCLRVGGWIAQSVTFNSVDPRFVKFNGPVTFNDRPDEYQLNQAYVFLERRTDTSTSFFDLGGKAALMYGTDARFTLAEGLDDDIVSDQASRFYKLSIPQLYAEAGFGNLAIQLGRFYSVLGYESIMAPDNFFNTHTYSFQYGEPLTYTGMLARYTGPAGVSLLGGFTRGWNNWEDNNDDLDVIAGLNWTSPRERSSLSLAVTSGPQDDQGLNDRTVASVVLDQLIGCRWNYVFHCDIGFENNGAAARRDAEWYGLVNYLVYDWNEFWSFGLRQEWFSDDDGVRVRGLGSPRGIDFSPVPAHWQDISLGVNYRPRENWLVRSEARWDWMAPLVPTPGGPFDDFNRRSQFVWSLDLIVGF